MAGKYECEGQLDIFSFISKDEPPVLLLHGQTIYKVRIGEVEEYVVSGREGYTYVYGDYGRGYYLDNIEGSGHGRAFNDSIGKIDFINLEDALKAACENRVIHKAKRDGEGVIYLQNITAFRKFRYRDYNGSYFYAEIGFLQNDLLYVKDWYCYRFVYPNKKGLYEKYLKGITNNYNIKSNYEEMEVDINYNPPCKWYTSKSTGDVPMGVTMYWDDSMKCYREAKNMCFL